MQERDVIAVRYGQERAAEWNNCLYVIRDVWSSARPARCEYKVRRNGRDDWLPCIEGVRFADIEPYEIAI